MSGPVSHATPGAGAEPPDAGAQPDAGARPDPTWLFGLFSALFALSLLLHQIWWGGFEVTSPHAVVVLTAIGALLRPTSVPRFALMLAAEVVALALDMPFVGSHTLLVLVIAGAVLVQLAVMAGRSRGVPGPGAVFDAIAPFLRVALIGVYATAALAKLNTGFLDPVRSCAVSMSAVIAWVDPTLLDTSWRAPVAIVGTIATEAALPVLLAVRRTRLVGVVLGGWFHVVLALAGNVPFTALAFALYVVFLPLDTAERIRALGLPRLGPGRRGRLVVGAVLVGAWLAAAALAASDPGAAHAAVGNGTRLVVVVVAVGCGGLLVASRVRAPGPPLYPAGSLRVGRPVLAAAVALLVLNAASPYLGLKTDASFEMFSNLRTEPGAWNQLLVPEAVRVFGYQDAPLRLLAASDPALLARAAGPVRITGFELERALRARPGGVATVLVGDDPTPRTVGPLPPGATAAERIAIFRDVPPPGFPRC